MQCLEPKFYAEFLEKLGVAGDASFAQSPDSSTWDALADRISAVIGSRTLEDWAAVFGASDACVAPVLDPAQASRHPHLVARGTWTEVAGQLQARAAPRFDGLRPDDPGYSPSRGEHTDEILASLNLR